MSAPVSFQFKAHNPVLRKRVPFIPAVTIPAPQSICQPHSDFGSSPTGAIADLEHITALPGSSGAILEPPSPHYTSCSSFRHNPRPTVWQSICQPHSDFGSSPIGAIADLEHITALPGFSGTVLETPSLHYIPCSSFRHNRQPQHPCQKLREMSPQEPPSPCDSPWVPKGRSLALAPALQQLFTSCPTLSNPTPPPISLLRSDFNSHPAMLSHY
ncbi:hypothetical protein DV515_00015320, partial [Chloebia gouldiae]